MPKSFSSPGIAAGLLVLALAAYSSALRGGFVWDDESYVTGNADLTSAAGLRAIWLEREASPQYYPLVFTTFWVERHLWGLAPFGYHLGNVLLHAGSAILLWRLLVRLRVPGALFAATLFLLHPVGVESVAWITERKNVLSLFLMLGAASAWFRFRPLAPAEGPAGAAGAAAPQGAVRWYGLALLLFAGALLSKSVTAALPAAILVIQWWKRGRIRPADVALLLPMLVLGGLAGGNTARLEVEHVGAQGPEWEQTMGERLLIAGRAPWFYLGKLLFPHPLAFFYRRWTVDPEEWRQWLFPAGAVVLVTLLWALRRRLGRGPLAAALLFGGLLVPASGLFPLFPQRFSFVADHFQYHASLGPLVLLAAGGARHFAAAERRGIGRALAALVLVGLGTLTWRQGRVFASLETLWADTVAKTPTSWAALLHLGLLRYDEGRTAEGLALAERAVRYAPAVSEAQMSLAGMRAAEGDVEGALALYGPLLAARPVAESIPIEVATQLGKKGKRRDAIRLLEGLERLRPMSAAIQARLGAVYAEEGRREEARARLRAAVALDPQNVEAHFNLGNVYAQEENWAEAIHHFQAVASLQPDFRDVQRRLAVVRQKERGGR
ncbi:MAG: tetratricopeptide repeat protein [Planctomycetota bacterium]